MDPSATKGVRLVASDSPSRGRVELASAEPWLTGGEVPLAWLPVCALDFDDVRAKILCELMGFKYGRMYSSRAIAYRPAPEGDPGYPITSPVEWLECTEGGGEGGGEGEASPPGDPGSSWDWPFARVALPPGAPYFCSFQTKTFAAQCEFTGPLAGVEDETGPSGFVALTGLDLEPNLCPEGDDECMSYGRVELLVDPVSPGRQVWAPVCAVPLDADFEVVVNMGAFVCMQMNNWRQSSSFAWWGSTTGTSFALPETPVSGEGELFDPSQHSAWVTVFSMPEEAGFPIALQKFGMEVSDTPCPHGLLAVICTVQSP
ncbi:hypothetical protein HYH03_005020 [Edaphochlamys debaryana]|uniref:SRCR domain-containing protein n=1 Tax=Edaphochlamys debaryana TaxID=47281 RepID=A0A835Y8L6_9CHLO|nr:hypothetical protein HYH03_005020 [Edaphochlamys debaryana]|eukprot:KAG2497017.1 hypothetical protein HYH03_005020 [Edaphochlamys debaryana]